METPWTDRSRFRSFSQHLSPFAVLPCRVALREQWIGPNMSKPRPLAASDLRSVVNYMGHRTDDVEFKCLAFFWKNCGDPWWVTKATPLRRVATTGETAFGWQVFEEVPTGNPGAKICEHPNMPWNHIVFCCMIKCLWKFLAAYAIPTPPDQLRCKSTSMWNTYSLTMRLWMKKQGLQDPRKYQWLTTYECTEASKNDRRRCNKLTWFSVIEPVFRCLFW